MNDLREQESGIVIVIPHTIKTPPVILIFIFYRSQILVIWCHAKVFILFVDVLVGEIAISVIASHKQFHHRIDWHQPTVSVLG